MNVYLTSVRRAFIGWRWDFVAHDNFFTWRAHGYALTEARALRAAEKRAALDAEATGSVAKVMRG